MNNNILLTGAGAPGMPGIIRCLKGAKDSSKIYYGADMNPNASCKNEFHRFFEIPSAQDNSFIPSLLKICEENKINLLMSCVTRELFKLADFKKDFKAIGTTVGVMDPEFLNIANNKGLLLEKLKKLEIDTPKFYIANNWNEIEESAALLGYPQKSFCVKGVVGNGSRAVRLIKDYNYLSASFFNDKPNGTVCSYQELKNTLTCVEKWPCKMLVMEELPGREYAVDILAKDGNVLCMVCRRALLVVSSNQMQCIIEENKYIENLCNEVVKNLNLSGNIGVDLKEDVNGVPKIMEINPRFTGGIVACYAAGVNFPYIGIKSYLGEEFDVPQIKYGVRMIRRLEELFFDKNGVQIYI